MSNKPTLSLRRPPKPDPAAVEAFVKQGPETVVTREVETTKDRKTHPANTQTSGRAGAQAPEPPDTQTFEPPDTQTSGCADTQTFEPPDTQTLSLPHPTAVSSGPGLVQRKGGRIRRRMTIYLPPQMAQELMIRAVEEGREASEIAAEALGRYLGKSH